MRLEPKRIGQFLTVCAMVLATSCDKDDRLTGGTNGTEAENAVAVVLRTPDGAPAIGARVVVRPIEEIDSTHSAQWVRQTTDSNGRATLRIPEGRWKLEARLGTLGLHLDVPDRQHPQVDTFLLCRHSLSGIVIGSAVGTRIHLPGLAMSAALDAEGRFSFPDVSPGLQSLQVGDMDWTMPDSVHFVAVTLTNRSNRFYPGARISVPGSPLPTRLRLPDSLVPRNASFLDASGAWVPTMVGPLRDGFRQVWMGASATKIVALVTKPDAPASPFASAEGLRLAWIPELGEGDLSGSATNFVPDSSTIEETDSAEGRFIHADLGLSLGSFPAGSLADNGAFSIAMRTRLLTRTIGSLWLLDWTDSVQNGIRIGIGGGRLRVVAGSIDTSIVFADSGAWSNWATICDGRSLSVWSDGGELIRLESETLADRQVWTRRRIGTGGALAMSQLLGWNLAVDGAIASRPPEARP